MTEALKRAYDLFLRGMNPMLLVDGYKLDHRRQYPDDTWSVYSNWTARGSRIPGVTSAVAFGEQYFNQRYLVEMAQLGFFSRPIDDVIKEYEELVLAYLGPNDIGTKHIGDLHDLGYFPLEIRAIPEGTSVPLRVPMSTMQNTIKEFFWLTNYFETLKSNIVWMPINSATRAREMRKVLEAGQRATGGPEWFTDWQGHDFSFRGMAGVEAALLSGAGHLLFFTGTDTVPAIPYMVKQYYGGFPDGYLIGGSVAATEHSVMCAGGKAGEGETFDRLMRLYPGGILSVVSDTWNLWDVLTKLLPSRKEAIMSRNGKLVIRPDSGDPANIVCGDVLAPAGSPESKGVIQLLWETFGGTVNAAGFKELDGHIGCIYGDAISKERAQEIIARLAARGFASCNIVFGVGSYTYQYNTRDTLSQAMKATWVEINGEGIPIFKQPVTDDGVKNSAHGRLAVARNESGLYVIENATPEQEAASLLRTTWKDGVTLIHDSYDVVRARARADIAT
jgi:nicotinamide phosphoribosyltransferase